MSDRPEVPDIDVDFPMPSGIQPPRGEGYQTLFIADLAGGDSSAIGQRLQSGISAVTADSFDEFLRSAAPSVQFTAADPLGGGAMVEVALRFESLRDFDPKSIAERMPATKSLMGFRQKLVERLAGRLTAAQLSEIARQVAGDGSLAWTTESLKWSPGATQAAPAGAVDDVLSQIDFGDSAAPSSSAAPKSPIAAAVSAAAGAGGSIPAEEASAVRRTLAELDRRLNGWLNFVLHSAPVQSLESAWRSLAFLVSQTDFRKGAKLSVLHASRASLLERFRTLLIDPVFDQGADSPDLIVADYSFGNTAEDIETLDELAQHAASLPAVVLANAAPAFFGVKHAWQIPTLPAFVSMFDQWQFAKWKTLRDQSYSRSLGMVFGRALLRSPHGPAESAGANDFVCRESVAGDADCVWAGGATAGACAIARSVADTGWPTAMAGYVHGRVEGFKTGQGGPKGDKKIGPTDTMMPLPKIQEMAVAGLNAAVGIKDHDDVIVWNGLSAARPAKFEQDKLLEISLPYQLFAARLAHLLFLLKTQLTDMAADKAADFIKAHVTGWLTVPGEPAPEQIAVQTRPPENDPAGLQFALTVTPPAKILPGAIPMVLGYRIR